MDTTKIPPPKEFPIPADFHQNNRQRFLNNVKQLGDLTNRVLLLKGSVTIDIHDDDQEYTVEQESNFFYLFGVQETGCYGVLELDTGKTIVFVPKIPESSKMWMVVKSVDDIKQQYKLDQVYYEEEFPNFLATKKPNVIYYYQGVDSDSKRQPAIPTQDFLKQYNSNHEDIYSILNETRVFKSQQEIDILRYAARLSSDAHVKVLRKIAPGNKEYQIEALFKYETMVNSGCRYKAYDCICAGGRAGATLHYIVNDQYIKDDTFVLCDMGAKYYGYCSDITVTFPSGGKFNDKQKVVYNAVLDAQRQVFSRMKVGVNWGDLHMLAERVIASNLLQAGLLKGDIDQINQNRIGQLFFPHGLGHLLGMRTHDVGGYNKGCPPRSQEIPNLRFRRDLQAGMVFTNEPGCYFIQFILDAAYADPVKSQFLNKELIDQYMEVGGVRLEDDIAMTENGPEILNRVPRTVQEVESCMRGEDWMSIIQ